jgi:hypothetical protein
MTVFLEGWLIQCTPFSRQLLALSSEMRGVLGVALWARIQ